MSHQIDIAIDTLIIHGITSFDADDFGAALRGELARLLEGTSHHTTVWHVEAVQLHLRGPLDADTLGVQVAQAIYTGIEGSQR